MNPRRLGANTALVQPSVIEALGVSANGRFAITGDELGVARVFSLASGTITAEVKVPSRFRALDRRIREVWVSDDGARVLLELSARATLVSGDVRRWEPTIHLGGTLTRSFLSPSGKLVVQASVGVEGFRGERKVLDVFERDASAIDCAISSEDVVVAAFDRRKKNDGPTPDVGILRAFTSTGKPIARVEVKDDFHRVRVGFADARTVVAVTEVTGRVYRWNLDAPKTPKSARVSKTRLPTFQLLASIGHLACWEPGRTSLVRLEDGALTRAVDTETWAASENKAVVLTAEGGSIVRRDPKSLEPLGPSVKSEPVRGVAFSRDGASLWSGDSVALTQWDLDSGGVIAKHALPKGFHTQAIAASGSVALLSGERASRVLELATGRLGKPIAATHRIPAISEDGAFVATHDGTGDSVIWNATTGTPVERFSKPTRTWYGRAFDPKGKWFVSCDVFGETRVWDAKTGALKNTFFTPNKKSGWGMAIAPDGKSLVMGGDASVVHLVALPNGRPLLALRGLKGQGDCRIAISPNGKWVAAANEQSAIVWARATGKRHVFHDGPAYAIAFSPDSKQVALGGVGEVSIFTL